MVEGNKEKRKDVEDIIKDGEGEHVLDGKGLHDLYRHTAKLIK